MVMLGTNWTASVGVGQCENYQKVSYCVHTCGVSMTENRVMETETQLMMVNMTSHKLDTKIFGQNCKK